MNKEKYYANPLIYNNVNIAAYELTLEFGQDGWSWSDLAEASGYSRTTCREYYDEDFMTVLPELKNMQIRDSRLLKKYKNLNDEIRNVAETNSVFNNVYYIYE